MPTLEKGYIGGMSQFRKEWLRAKKTGKMRGQSEAAFRECFFQWSWLINERPLKSAKMACMAPYNPH